MKLPKEYVIVEIIPTHSTAKVGMIAQLQALKIKDDKIIGRLDLRIDDKLIEPVSWLTIDKIGLLCLCVFSACFIFYFAVRTKNEKRNFCRLQTVCRKLSQRTG